MNLGLSKIKLYSLGYFLPFLNQSYQEFYHVSMHMKYGQSAQALSLANEGNSSNLILSNKRHSLNKIGLRFISDRARDKKIKKKN